MGRHINISGEKVEMTPAYPPFRMKAKDAAYYCGMSDTAFLRAVADGDLPKGKKLTGGRFWLRHELEHAMVDESPQQHDFSKPI